MRYRNHNAHPVHWPAFVDILMVLVVVLTSILALRPSSCPVCETCKICPAPTPCEKPLPCNLDTTGQEAKKNGVEVTPDEYEETLRGLRSSCFRNKMKLKVVKREGWLYGEMICDFAKDGCASATSGLKNKLGEQDPKILSSKYMIEFKVDVKALVKDDDPHKSYAEKMMGEWSEELNIDRWKAYRYDTGTHHSSNEVDTISGVFLIYEDVKLTANEKRNIVRLYEDRKWSELKALKENVRDCKGL